MKRAAKLLTAATALTLGAPVCLAHTHWGDGSPVSDEVRRRCCGEADAHLLPPGSVHARRDGWHIDGFERVVPFGQELPSPDGHEWGFWSEHRYDGYRPVGGQSEMYCLFLNPRNF